MWPSVVKEFRALFPLWIASIVAIALYALTGNRTIQGLAVFGYVFGSLALGAHVIGYEHSHRTLGVLLSQPIDRRRLLLAKFAVLTPLLLTMGVAARYLIVREFRPGPDLHIVSLGMLGGLFVAPWLTMLSRNQLAGVMLTGMAGGSSLVATTLLAAKMSGRNLDQAEQLGVEIWLPMMYAFAALSAILAWRTFMRLEAIDGAGTQIHLPRWFRAAERARGGHPVWLLIKKELRLQQLTFVMAGLFVAGWAVLTIRAYLAADGLLRSGGSIVDVLTAIYLAAMALLVGSLASAEERQCGMLESQQLLPMRARAQWVIKAGVAVALALLLAIGLPAVLAYAGGPAQWLRGVLPHPGISALLIVVLTACSLYVSSLSTSGVRALAVAFPFVVAAFTLVQFIEAAMSRRFFNSTPYVDLAVTVAAVAFTALLLSFAGANHRRSERSVRRVLWQVSWAAAIIVIGLPLITAILALTI